MRSYSEFVKQIGNSKGISVLNILEAIGESIKSAAKKKFQDDDNIVVHIDEENQSVGVYQVKEVVEDGEDVVDPRYYITQQEAKTWNALAGAGDDVEIEIDPADFSRIETHIAKNKMNEHINRSEITTLENEYKSKIGEIIGGDFQRRFKGTIYINLGRVEGILPYQEQSPRDRFKIGDRIKCYIKGVRIEKRQVRVLLSRVDTDFIKKLFEQEIPEIYDKTIEIRGIAREPGKKIKVIVYSKKSNIDPVGACVGMKGVRIQSIVQELNGEMIDVIRWSESAKVLIASALKPAEITYVSINEAEKKAVVVVRGDQLSLAIGNKGLNAKLAAKATGWSIDIKTEDQFDDVRKQEESRQKAAEALGIGQESKEDLVEDIEYEIDEDFTVEDLGLSDSINKKLLAAGFSNIEKLIDKDEADLMEEAKLTIKQSQKVVSTLKEAIEVIEENVEDE